VKYATRKFTDARYQRKNKCKDQKASKSGDIEKIVDESGEKFPSMKVIDRQLTKLVDNLLVKSPTEIKSDKDTMSDTKPLKENKSLNIEIDIDATDKSFQSTIGAVFTYDVKDDDMLNETRLKAEKTISFESIDKAYQEEMLQVSVDKEAVVNKPTNYRPSTESGSGFPLAEDMHVYLDELFVISKRGSQMFDEYVSVTREKRRKDKQQEDVSESGPTSAVVDIAKDFTVADSNLFGDVLFKDQCGPILSDTIEDRADDNDSDASYVVSDTFGNFLDIGSDNSMSIDIVAVGEISDSHTQGDVLVIEAEDELVNIAESNNDILDFEAIVFQDVHDEVDITAARNDIDDTYFTYNDIVDDEDNLFGIMNLYIKSDLHLHDVSTLHTYV
jgi:hypothetical protein